MQIDDLNDNDPEADALLTAINTNIARDTQTAELLRQAIDVVWRLRNRLTEQGEELRLCRELIQRQQNLLFQKGIVQ